MTLSFPPEVQARLLDLVDFDTEVIQTNRRIVEANAAIGALSSNAEYQQLVLDAEAAADRLDDVQRECDHLESDIAIARARIERDRAREAETNDSKELTELEHEINSLERRIDSLEQTELEVLERREALEAARNELVAARDSFHDERDAKVNELSADIARLSERLDAIARSRATLVSELPADLVDLYERQRERYGVGASLLRRGISGASGVQLTPSQLDEVRATDPNTVLLCPDSNAILIRTADSGL